MGTFETLGGTSRDDLAAVFEPIVFPEEGATIAILEAAGVHSQAKDLIATIVAQTAGRVAELTKALFVLRELVRREEALIAGSLLRDSQASRWCARLQDAIEHQCKTAGI